ncbi:MAG TPA: response regulator transcription factor [Candidatus Angelobacter sp.]|nr:response regulator transcription factor [Candidatus Angelobacter sp.]
MNWAARGTLSLEGKRQRQTAAEPAAAGAQKIFVVEDDLDIARLVRHHLEGAGFQVRGYTSNAGVLADAQKERPCLLLLDIMVPGGDGLDLCRQVRQSGAPLAATPVVFLTAKTAEADRIFGLETGADDYITKPFSPRELLARIKAVLRRCEAPLAPASIVAGDLSIDADAMTLSVRGQITAATATEFRLLHYLARHPGRVFTRDQILDAVWKETTFVSPRSVDVYVRKLREKIEVDPEQPRYLKTVRGTGYRFETPK